MKKLLLAFALFSGAFSAASAQSAAIGFDLGVAPCVEKGADLTNFEIDAKAQFYVMKDLRLEAKLGYGFKDKDISIFTSAINAHYMIPVVPKFEMYPLAGVGYARPIVHFHHGSEGFNRFLFNIGLGGQLNITSRLAAQIEFKYQYVKDFQRFPISVGISYKI